MYKRSVSPRKKGICWARSIKEKSVERLFYAKKNYKSSWLTAAIRLQKM
ncbi:hypothetical protein LX87_05046 [Larkinella arboricola]|uniref:Uncharacterized protein n=1 Tax=Larkinella arboricola TaxID=643671 RepID=A0A327WNG7_LARAB|nr:hypothetical protein LX87_05046 [Larkinella arboricola]